jgi:glyoxylase-like metal-dependent hydrolase (beta-lactamase superfamily II)
MLFRQFFERESSTYTYLIAPRVGGEALLIDPVKTELSKYLQLIADLDLRLVFAIDTHVHADHVTGLGDLRTATTCATLMGAQSRAECVSRKISDGERLDVGRLELRALYTPGHTDDSYSLVMADRVFTGDTLLIRGTGRTDFQNGDAAAQYESLFGKLLQLPQQTLVFPAHDYKGWTVSTIGEERAHNPRLQVRSKQEYVELMRSLRLPNPKQMDVAVPANLACGAVRGLATAKSLA